MGFDSARRRRRVTLVAWACAVASGCGFVGYEPRSAAESAEPGSDAEGEVGSQRSNTPGAGSPNDALCGGPEAPCRIGSQCEEDSDCAGGTCRASVCEEGALLRIDLATWDGESLGGLGLDGQGIRLVAAEGASVTRTDQGLNFDGSGGLASNGPVNPLIARCHERNALSLVISFIVPAGSTPEAGRLVELSEVNRPSHSNISLARSAAGPEEEALEIRMRTSETLSLGAAGALGEPSLSVTGASLPGAQRTVVYTWDETGAETLWNEGVMMATGSRPGTLREAWTAQRLFVGATQGGGAAWTGTLTELAFYCEALTGPDIAALLSGP